MVQGKLTQIYLPEPAYRWLKQESAVRGVTRSAILEGILSAELHSLDLQAVSNIRPAKVTLPLRARDTTVYSISADLPHLLHGRMRQYIFWRADDAPYKTTAEFAGLLVTEHLYAKNILTPPPLTPAAPAAPEEKTAPAAALPRQAPEPQQPRLPKPRFNYKL